MVHQSTIGGWAGRAQYYRNNREALLLEQSTIGATADYYRSTREDVLVQKNIIGALGRQSTIGAIGLLCRYIRVL